MQSRPQDRPSGRVCWRDGSEGVATATAALLNVMKRSSAPHLRDPQSLCWKICEVGESTARPQNASVTLNTYSHVLPDEETDLTCLPFFGDVTKQSKEREQKKAPSPNSAKGLSKPGAGNGGRTRDPQLGKLSGLSRDSNSKTKT